MLFATRELLKATHGGKIADQSFVIQVGGVVWVVWWWWLGWLGGVGGGVVVGGGAKLCLVSSRWTGVRLGGVRWLVV